MVKDATVEEIKKENSTILAVIRAVDDYSNGGVLNLCRRYDPDGRRTIAAITHPDVGNSRNLYVDLLCNGQIPDELKELKIQWHVLKNDPEGEQHSRDELEQKWFENNAKWKHVPSQFRGAKRLGERLRKVLFSVAKSQLPHIRDNIKSRTRELKMDIDALGCEVFEDKELRARFQAAVERLKYNARDHARGIWNSDILQFPETDPIRLRSRIVGDTEVFRDRLMKFGHTWNCCVLVSPPDPNHDLQSWHQPKLQIDGLTQRTFRSEDEEIDYVAYIIRNTRGQELPGDYRHGVISEVFWNLSRNWKVIAEQYVEEVYDHCCRYFHQAVPLSFAKPAKSSGFGNSKRVAGRYMELLVPRIDNVKIVALEGLSTLEEERKCHPVNFIRRFESERRRYRENARAANARAALNKIPDSTDDDRCHDGSTYAEDIGIHTQEQCIRNTARDYAIAAWIHYDNFLMNVITQVVGRHFTDHIEEIVPEANLELKDLKRLVRAEAHVERQKNKLEQELDILQRSLHVLLTS
ncbi:uncharacterized protein BDR25DRAFT_233292 [Lindgomyces ingoldianus]|uniref:Uncharacterized protein n=1 Tax=Lindgomyces ingoldianus TaxID=673940 RepID=A0ACB6QLP9_9PLEO|nr:uncharacterized protein BDR25DRAFT_233292 [Lindgomyces ingoldianus]KAF2467904.1 hypothetical protein BDR25DRAFT_233292 [Lindgomyces ingoldianus]